MRIVPKDAREAELRRLGFGIYPRDVREFVFQVVALIGLINLPQVGIGFATLARWPRAAWFGSVLSLFYLILVSVSLPTSTLTFGGVLDDPHRRTLVLCLLIVPGFITLFGYIVALVAQRAGRDGRR